MTPARPVILYLVLALFALLPQARGLAAELVDGSFLAVKDCPAYVSKIEQTNPDNLRLTPGRIYPVVATNYAEAPDAYRLRIDGADPKYRWVAADCGEYPPKSSPAEVIARFAESNVAAVPAELSCPTPPPQPDACRTCGKSDAYVLVLNWQPGLCQAGGKKLAGRPECQSTDPNAFYARNFTLRELRPTRAKCKKQVGFCGSVEREPKQLSDYPPVELGDPDRQALLRIMPAAADDSGLDRQAWHRYGSCTGLGAEGYFKLAGNLLQQFNQSGMANFMAANLGAKVRREDFFLEVEKALGPDARKHINIECSADAGILTGVVINLGGQITGPGADLRSLIQQGPQAGARGNCASRFLVDEIGQDAAAASDHPVPKAKAKPKAPNRQARERRNTEGETGDQPAGDRDAPSESLF
jgi:ribonuclease T2